MSLIGGNGMPRTSVTFVQLLHSATGQPPQERLLVAICGITKLFVGELVETGAFLSSPCARKLRMLHPPELRYEIYLIISKSEHGDLPAGLPSQLP